MDVHTPFIELTRHHTGHPPTYKHQQRGFLVVACCGRGGESGGRQQPARRAASSSSPSHVGRSSEQQQQQQQEGKARGGGWIPAAARPPASRVRDCGGGWRVGLDGLVSSIRAAARPSPLPPSPWAGAIGVVSAMGRGPLTSQQSPTFFIYQSTNRLPWRPAGAAGTAPGLPGACLSVFLVLRVFARVVCPHVSFVIHYLFI